LSSTIRLSATSAVKNAKVAVFTCALEAASTETKGTVLIESAEQLLNYNEGEESMLHAQIKAVVDSGVNVVVTAGSVSDMAKHFFDKYNIMVVKVMSQFDMRRVCRATKARAQVSMGAVGSEEIGFCAHVAVREFGLMKCTVFSQDEKDDSPVASIVLRASTQNILDDLERACDDGINVVKAMGRDQRFLAGAGASEIELARRLKSFGEKRAGLEQYSIKAYAEALEVVPRTLAENAGLDALQVKANLYAAHEKGETSVGVDILGTRTGSGVKDMTTESILDHQAEKANALRLASTTVLTILRVDQIIHSKPAGGPKVPGNKGHWDDD